MAADPIAFQGENESQMPSGLPRQDMAINLKPEIHLKKPKLYHHSPIGNKIN